GGGGVEMVTGWLSHGGEGRGGTCYSGSGRSVDKECFWFRPESSPKKFSSGAGGGRRWSTVAGGLPEIWEREREPRAPWRPLPSPGLVLERTSSLLPFLHVGYFVPIRLGLVLSCSSQSLITEARFEDENNQKVDNNVRNQEDPNMNDKQEVKKVDDQEIENIKDEEGKNAQDQQVSKVDDDTNNDDFDCLLPPHKGVDLHPSYENGNDRADYNSPSDTDGAARLEGSAGVL
nr:hypothetical protein [Tanacetum cinerariifolium]